MQIIRRLKRLAEAGKAARKARRDAEVSLRFYLSERSGRVFIVCNGTAVGEMPGSATVSSVSDEMEGMRAAALAYEELRADGQRLKTNDKGQ